jgi:hypothetical protein
MLGHIYFCVVCFCLKFKRIQNCFENALEKKKKKKGKKIGRGFSSQRSAQSPAQLQPIYVRSPVLYSHTDDRACLFSR